MFRRDTAPTIEFGQLLATRGDATSGEIIQPLLDVDDAVEKALTAGDYALAGEILDAARDDPREIFGYWRENARFKTSGSGRGQPSWRN